MVPRFVVFRYVLLPRSYVVVGAGVSWGERGWPLVVGLGLLGGGSVRVVASGNVMVVFTAFEVCRLVPATQGTYHWRVRLLSAICTAVGPSAFDTRIGFIAI